MELEAWSPYLLEVATGPCPDPVRKLPPYFCKICFKVIQSKPMYSKRSLPIRSSDQNNACLRISDLSHTCYMYVHLILLVLITLIMFGTMMVSSGPKSHTVFDRLNTGILRSILTLGMGLCPRFCVFVILCNRSIAVGPSLVQGFLTVFKNIQLIQNWNMMEGPNP
jgi:hypothetical protein